MTARFRDRAITLANDATGRTIDAPSASPRNYHQGVSAATEMPPTVIDGKLFLPPGARDPAGLPLVIVDRGTPVVRVADAAVAPGAPTTYLADDGAFIHPVSGQGDAALTDRDVAVYSLKAGYGVRGASPGSQVGEAAAFREDMLAFWASALQY